MAVIKWEFCTCLTCLQYCNCTWQEDQSETSYTVVRTAKHPYDQIFLDENTSGWFQKSLNQKHSSGQLLYITVTGKLLLYYKLIQHVTFLNFFIMTGAELTSHSNTSRPIVLFYLFIFLIVFFIYSSWHIIYLWHFLM